jgi:hypothetical protein
MIYKKKDKRTFHPVSVYEDNNGLKKLLHKKFNSSEVSKLFMACTASIA